MASYHFHLTQVKRSRGQSVIAQAAYRSGEKLYSTYYGESSDFTRKRGVVMAEICLPDHAPRGYADRETLWNALEWAESGRKAQLAHSFDITLMNEFSMEENIEMAAAYVGFPAIIKPNISAGAKGIVQVNSIEDIVRKFPVIYRQFGACTLQHFINHSGIYYNVMLYRSAQGHLIGWTVLKIMRYFPLKGGTSCYCETIQHDSLIRICAQVLDELQWVGFADFDIMEEKDTGKLKIIEINPRIPASIHGAYVSGVNFPDIIVRDVMGESVEQSGYRPGKSLRFMGLDFMWFLFSPDRFRFRPSWFRFFGRNVYYQDGCFKDPLPMLMGCVSGILKYLHPAFRKSKLGI